MAELRYLQVLARRQGVSFSFPLLVYGFAAVAGTPLLALEWKTAFDLWWLLVAVAAPVLIARHYRRRLRVHGISIGWLRAMRFVLAAELLAVALWVQPLALLMRNAPWLALIVTALAAGYAWRRPAMYVTAAGVAALVLAANVWAWPLPVPDLVIGLWLCVSGLVGDRWARRLPATMVSPAP